MSTSIQGWGSSPLFKGRSTFVGYIMPKLPFFINSSGIILPIAGKYKGVSIFEISYIRELSEHNCATGVRTRLVRCRNQAHLPLRHGVSPVHSRKTKGKLNVYLRLYA